MRRFIALLMALLFSLALAQTPEARQAADAGVRDWVAGKYRISPAQTPDTRDLVIRMLRFQQSIPVDTVDPNKGEFLVAQNNQEVYVYPLEGRVTGNVQVQVGQNAGTWTVQSVRTTLRNVGIPSWLKAPVFSWIFTALTVVILIGLLVPSPIRRGFVHAWKVALSRPYRGWFWGTQILLYGSFILGISIAYQDREFARELQLYLNSTLSSTGIQQFMTGGVLGLATAITLWNFVSGTFLTTFLPGLFLGFPAVIFNLFRFTILGIGLSPALIPTSHFIPHIPVIVLELQAYIFVASFAVVTTVRIFREGFGKAVKDYPLALLVAFVFLLLGNWYEAIELLYLVPRG
ncbi:hypothetical protein [Deinococcus cellulosilyticus]|uniref:Stage II sporulation protein M n=1 Tax=Deinococcus cellulosilyticus (strain DSM 18568 / NBRC 106333 / KACC 11606 / 5516J-15) TaxID=1223518 RepID=A0A511N4X7_DEIC1|nr:hypothetical protein [Deinococcus cellulosilyticus]GEM47471.1 hypothetical protein DC3_31060 [Deinococcus cellulosilyticus NBRC 106333 = KACC 11606]